MATVPPLGMGDARKQPHCGHAGDSGSAQTLLRAGCQGEFGAEGGAGEPCARGSLRGRAGVPARPAPGRPGCNPIPLPSFGEALSHAEGVTATGFQHPHPTRAALGPLFPLVVIHKYVPPSLSSQTGLCLLVTRGRVSTCRPPCPSWTVWAQRAACPAAQGRFSAGPHPIARLPALTGPGAFAGSPFPASLSLKPLPTPEASRPHQPVPGALTLPDPSLPMKWALCAPVMAPPPLPRKRSFVQGGGDWVRVS